MPKKRTSKRAPGKATVAGKKTKAVTRARKRGSAREKAHKAKLDDLEASLRTLGYLK